MPPTITDAHLMHTTFDLLAVAVSLLGGWLCYRKWFVSALPETTASIGYGYFIALSLGSITGAYLLGTANLYLSGIPEIGRSIIGGLAGATLMVELYKQRRGVKKSTGYFYVVPICLCIIVGRIGCLLSGLHDHTHGIPTRATWGWDFGDRVLRHPVQLYESVAMLFFLLCVLVILARKPNLIVRYGFYLCIGFYAAQRFFWEFLKPYHKIMGTLNIFQYTCLVLLIYSAFMVWKTGHDLDTA